MKKLKTLVVFLLCFILAMPTAVAKAQTSQTLPQNTPISTWLWNTREIVDNSDKIIQFLTANNVSAVYLQVDYNLNVDYYKNFINKASINNIKIHALDGSPDWASDGGSKFYNSFFTWLGKYQQGASVNEKFSGVHLDVEPYLNSQYNKAQNRILQNYQDYIIAAVSSSSNLNLEFAIDIPFWFYGTQYKNKHGKGNIAEWLFQRVKNVTIMAYRDTAEGANGIIKIAETQMNLCKKYNVKATIAVETGRIDETPFITFYEEGLAHMYNQLNIVNQYYSPHQAFNGFAIHYLENWMTMN